MGQPSAGAVPQVGRAGLIAEKPEPRAEGMRFGDRTAWLPSACASGFAAGGWFASGPCGTTVLKARAASRGNAVWGSNNAASLSLRFGLRSRGVVRGWRTVGGGVPVGGGEPLSSKPEARAEGMRFGDRTAWSPSACASGFAAGGWFAGGGLRVAVCRWAVRNHCRRSPRREPRECGLRIEQRGFPQFARASRQGGRRE